jgi:hypothetical protein
VITLQQQQKTSFSFTIKALLIFPFHWISIKNLFLYPLTFSTLISGDEVLEVAGVSLRGKSALFVENFMRNLQNEFEITIRHQTANANDEVNPTPVEHRTELTNASVERHPSMGASPLISQPSNSNSTCKSKSTSIYSLNQATSGPSEIPASNDLPTDRIEPNEITCATVSYVY